MIDMTWNTSKLPQLFRFCRPHSASASQYPPTGTPEMQFGVEAPTGGLTLAHSDPSSASARKHTPPADVAHANSPAAQAMGGVGYGGGGEGIGGGGGMTTTGEVLPQMIQPPYVMETSEDQLRVLPAIMRTLVGALLPE